MAAAGSSSDTITTSLASLSKAKRIHENNLISEIKNTNRLKVEVQDLMEKLTKLTLENGSLQDARQLTADKSRELMSEATRLEEDNKKCTAGVESLDRQMLGVRDQQRATELDYSVMLNELRQKITNAKSSYSPEITVGRTDELRKRKQELLGKCATLESAVSDMNCKPSCTEKGQEVWDIVRTALEE